MEDNNIISMNKETVFHKITDEIKLDEKLKRLIFEDAYSEKFEEGFDAVKFRFYQLLDETI